MGFIVYLQLLALLLFLMRCPAHLTMASLLGKSLCLLINHTFQPQQMPLLNPLQGASRQNKRLSPQAGPHSSSNSFLYSEFLLRLILFSFLLFGSLESMHDCSSRISTGFCSHEFLIFFQHLAPISNATHLYFEKSHVRIFIFILNFLLPYVSEKELLSQQLFECGLMVFLQRFYSKRLGQLEQLFSVPNGSLEFLLKLIFLLPQKISGNLSQLLILQVKEPSSKFRLVIKPIIQRSQIQSQEKVWKILSQLQLQLQIGKQIQQMMDSYSQAIANLNTQNFQIAIDGFNKSIAAGINPEQSMRMRSQAYFYGNRYQSAVSSYQELIDRFPNCEDGYYGKALSLAMLGQFADVEKLFKKAIQLNPKNWKIYFTKGYISLKMRKYDQALTMFQQALTKNQLNDPICYIGQAAVFCVKRNFQISRKNIQYARKAVQNPENHKLLYQFQIPKVLDSLSQYQKDLSNIVSLQQQKKIKPETRGQIQTSLTMQLCTSIMLNNPIVFRQFSQKMSTASTDEKQLTILTGDTQQKSTPICQCNSCSIF